MPWSSPYCGLALRSCLLLSLLAMGCGGQAAPKDRVPTFKAGGIVTYKGQPVEGALVRLISRTPEAMGASATTDKEGRFQLMTYQPGDGAPEGNYLVVISKTEASKTSEGTGNVDSPDYVPPKEVPYDPDRPPPAPKNLLPAKFGNAAKTPLMALIDGPTDELKFELTD